MPEPVVLTSGLRKVYGSKVALDGVDLRVERGSVYGLVGPNGAGKTTLLGVLGGLRAPSAGTVSLGVERRRIAVMPDTPEFELWLTAREVVDLSRTLVAPGLPANRVEEALAIAGLTSVARVRVGGFSRGMLQRLGLAATIVGDPELLILDEPSAALDPAGRRDVLDLVAALGRRATVLFSSHILSDVQRVCDSVGILREGRLLYQGPLDRLLSGTLTPTYLVRLREPVGPGVAALQGASWVKRVEPAERPDELRVLVTSFEEAEMHLAKALGDAGVRVVAMEPASLDLESAFLELTS